MAALMYRTTTHPQPTTYQKFPYLHISVDGGNVWRNKNELSDWLRAKYHYNRIGILFQIKIRYKLLNDT